MTWCPHCVVILIMLVLQRLSPHQLQLPALAWALALLYSVGGGGLARGGELCPVTVSGNTMVTMYRYGDTQPLPRFLVALAPVLRAGHPHSPALPRPGHLHTYSQVRAIRQP